ncbi:MFS transporter [Leucobacter sp. OLJS4]|uniref:MFS transporter n=1 Tax=unclassified Leucobacter TaxID=2621730 RepID=UPI000C1956C3|nr:MULTISPECIES: MFS transporter [unclassified Leucobacter]PIJ51478.1 MFS transporter [Leucobacter sp. OLES1]PII83316.1 MFS transporter [Leucobacter sp. OLCALW19]PII86867.1 MFS transporter [Leucobacter sp. OLTLW20]PII91197.1 MFS transporter [Leucobacter sp. OLAS13]PII98656.1 MFS transporter [Leucobacter sp. OLDS2]
MSSAPATASSPRELRRVAAATVIGTTIEWYDFFLYASAAGLVFGELFFKPAGPQAATIISFATVGVSFLFRPLGAFLAGHFGDRVGRKAMLVITLILMGAATTLIGVLPTYSQVGMLAPVLLMLLRILQGLSTGGEWGGAVLMAVEHAPSGKRGLMGAYPQIGVPIGLLLASGVLALMTGVVSPGAAFLEWGWRIPFLLSFVLVVVGIFVRRAVEESPVFTEISERKEQTKIPIVQLFKKHWLLVILAALTFAGNNAAGYMTTGGYIQNYATTPVADGGLVGMERTPVLLAVAGASVVWLAVTFFAGAISDRIGRRNTYIAGWIAFLAVIFVLFPLVNTGDVWLLFLGLALFAIGNGLTYGPQAAYFAELFPASIRYSGVSIAYAIGAILGGAFAPMISAWLVAETGTAVSVAFYIAGVMVIAFVATLLLRDRTGIPLGPEHEELQQRGHFVWEKAAA